MPAKPGSTEKPSAAPEVKPAEGQKPPEEKPKSPEDTKALTAFMSKWLGPVPEEKPAKETPKEEPAKKPKEEAPVKEEAKPEPEPPKKKAKAKAPPPIDTEQVIEAAAQGVVRAMEQQRQQAEQKKTETVQQDFVSKLPATEQKKVSTLRVMEEMLPEKYKGIADKYAKATAEAIEYARKWEQEHEGETFDEEAPEHEEFFSQRNVDWQDDDFDEARAEALVRARVGQIESKFTEEISEIKLEKRLKEEAPKIDRHQLQSAKSFLETVDPRLPALFGENGLIDQEALKALQKTDPVLVGVALGHFAQNVVEPLTGEIYRLCNGLSKFDSKRDDHKFISEFATRCEQDMLEQPEEKRVNEKGQTFITSAEYNRLPDAKRARHWVLSPEEISALLAADAAHHAKKIISVEREKYVAWCKSQGIEVPGAGEKGVEPAPQQPARSANEKPVSPTVTSAPKVAGTGSVNGGDGSDPKNAFLNRFLGQS